MWVIVLGLDVVLPVLAQHGLVLVLGFGLQYAYSPPFPFQFQWATLKNNNDTRKVTANFKNTLLS